MPSLQNCAEITIHARRDVQVFVASQYHFRDTMIRKGFVKKDGDITTSDSHVTLDKIFMKDFKKGKTIKLEENHWNCFNCRAAIFVK